MGHRICISNQFPGAADVPSPGATGQNRKESEGRKEFQAKKEWLGVQFSGRACAQHEQGHGLFPDSQDRDRQESRETGRNRALQQEETDRGIGRSARMQINDSICFWQLLFHLILINNQILPHCEHCVFFCFVSEIESHYVGQAGLKLLGSIDPLSSASWVLGLWAGTLPLASSVFDPYYPSTFHREDVGKLYYVSDNLLSSLEALSH